MQKLHNMGLKCFNHTSVIDETSDSCAKTLRKGQSKVNHLLIQVIDVTAESLTQLLNA